MSNDQRTQSILEELLAWTKFAYRRQFSEGLEAVLSDPKHFKAYEASDGTANQPEVARISGLSQPTVSALWTKWRRLGIVRDIDGRAAHLARPSDLGIEPRRE